jgi:predicted secreted protein
MSLFPIILVGGAIVILSGKKKKKKSGIKALPASTDRGEIFEGGDPPDIIMDQVGSRFSIRFPELGSTGHRWRLSASPPDNSVELVAQEFDKGPEIPEGMTGASTGDEVYIFEGKKTGEGSIVFHLDPPGPPPQPPAEVVEIKTKIS